MNYLNFLLNLCILSSILNPIETIDIISEFVSLLMLSARKKNVRSIIILLLSFPIPIISLLAHEVCYLFFKRHIQLTPSKTVNNDAIRKTIQKVENINTTPIQKEPIEAILDPVIIEKEQETDEIVRAEKEQINETVTNEKEKIDETVVVEREQINDEPSVAYPTRDEIELGTASENNDVVDNDLPLKNIHVTSVSPSNDVKPVAPYTIDAAHETESTHSDKTLEEEHPDIIDNDTIKPLCDQLLNKTESKQPLDSVKVLVMQEQQEPQKQQIELLDSPLSAPATPALTPSNRRSAANSTCSRRSSDTSTTHHASIKDKLLQQITTNEGSLNIPQIPDEYKMMSPPPVPSVSKNRFPSIRLKRKKTVNKKASEDSVPPAEPKLSVSSKIQDKLKKSGKRISKMFM